jgi:hypothetical protein
MENKMTSVNGKNVVAFILILFAVQFSVIADEQVKMQPVKRVVREGGLVQTRTPGKKIVLLNTQNAVSSSQLTRMQEDIQTYFQMVVVVVEGSVTNSALQMAQCAAEKDVAITIGLGKDPGNPALLVAPEDGWALVTVSSLMRDQPNEKKLNNRVQKELWRAFGYLMGATYSPFDCVMKPVRNLHDLDSLTVNVISPACFETILEFAKKQGMSQIRKATYKTACEEGWAPEATNEVQRAIYQDGENKKKAKKE